MVFVGVSADLGDRGGMTALMWSCWKIAAIDPTRLLITLGASTRLADNAHGNTALHWAILARNAQAISSLIFHGKAAIDIPNHRGDTAISMLQPFLGQPWIAPNIVEMVFEYQQAKQKRNFCKWVISNKVRDIILC